MNDDPLRIELSHGEYCGQRETGGDSAKAGHLLPVRKWGGKTSDYTKSGGARTKNSW